MIYERKIEGVMFRYDGETGQIWRRLSKFKKWKETGKALNRGYFMLKFNCKNEFVHRLAWCIRLGEWPNEEIDHIDGLNSNNKEYNLREATSGQNKRNTLKVTNTGYVYLTSANGGVIITLDSGLPTRFKKWVKSLADAIIIRNRLLEDRVGSFSPMLERIKKFELNQTNFVSQEAHVIVYGESSPYINQVIAY